MRKTVKEKGEMGIMREGGRFKTEGLSSRPFQSLASSQSVLHKYM